MFGPGSVGLRAADFRVEVIFFDGFRVVVKLEAAVAALLVSKPITSSKNKAPAHPVHIAARITTVSGVHALARC